MYICITTDISSDICYDSDWDSVCEDNSDKVINSLF